MVLGQRSDVLSVGAASSRPFERFGSREMALIEGRQVPVVHAWSGYLETLGVRLVDGQLPLQEHVERDQELAVITTSAARLLAPMQRAVGASVSLPNGRSATVTGVIDDVTMNVDSRGPTVYLHRRSLERATIVARVRTRSATTFAAVKGEIVAIAPPASPIRIAWIADALDAHSRRDPRFRMVVFGSFAALGLVLAAVGIFAIVAAMVVDRRHEMGVRLAIGASPRALVRGVVLDAAASISAGALASLAALWLLTRTVPVPGFDAFDAGVVAVGMLTVVVAGCLAAYLAARRAGRVDPVVVLRSE
jgi:hypothetical protein